MESLISRVSPIIAVSLAGFVAGWLASAGRAAEPIVELPKVEVRDSRLLPPPESWDFAALPGFEILTNVPQEDAQRLMRDFQLFRQALDQVWRMPERPAQPTLLILCGSRSAFEGFVPEGQRSVPSRLAASVFLQDRGRAAIVLDCASRTAGILSSSGEDDTPVERHRELYRQYIRLVTSRIEPRPPAWFEEGIAQIAKAMEFDRKSIVFGKVQSGQLVSPTREAKAAGSSTGAGDGLPDVDLGVENRGFSALLRGSALMPLERFFAVERTSAEARLTHGDAVWPQQAYAFVHLCLYGEGGRYQKPFALFLRRLGREPVSEALFKECFHLGYEQMLTELRGYMDFTLHTYQVFQTKGEGLEAPREVVLREATPAEVGRLKGEALELAGYTGLARDFLLAPYVRGEHDAPLLAALGLLELRLGQAERARKFLEAAARDAAPLRPEAGIELAGFRLAEAKATPKGTAGKLSAAQIAAVVDLLIRAQAQPPQRAIGFELLAETWRLAEAPPPEKEIERLIYGAQLFPTRLAFVYDTAVLCRQAGLVQPARALAAHGIKHAQEPALRTRFEQLAAELAR